mmetsp:Transcript_54513/g.165075  ORF Transcript_54513/g.165075 Transcript_54513/m.165075 type:complete len:311 (+) Transcript_54513:290-1222(+)
MPCAGAPPARGVPPVELRLGEGIKWNLSLALRARAVGGLLLEAVGRDPGDQRLLLLHLHGAGVINALVKDLGPHAAAPGLRDPGGVLLVLHDRLLFIGLTDDLLLDPSLRHLDGLLWALWPLKLGCHLADALLHLLLRGGPEDLPCNLPLLLPQDAHLLAVHNHLDPRALVAFGAGLPMRGQRLQHLGNEGEVGMRGGMPGASLPLHPPGQRPLAHRHEVPLQLHRRTPRGSLQALVPPQDGLASGRFHCGPGCRLNGCAHERLLERPADVQGEHGPQNAHQADLDGRRSTSASGPSFRHAPPTQGQRVP